MSRDITERKLAEAAICKQEAATQASRAKNEFLSRVSHELRTPLNAVIGFSQLLLHGGASRMESGQRVYVEHILSAGRHLLEMINDIMDLTRLESSPASVKMVPVKLCDLVESCLPMILPQAQARGITVVAQAALSEHSHIMGDERRLKQVLINVLSNAVKYNEVGGLVTIRCEHRQTHPGELALIITDTGRGLTELQIKGLFEPFNRLGADQAGIDGTGLGLVISRRLIELMGGSIAVESTYGSGTAVTLCLPKSNIEVHAQPDSSHLKPLSGDMARREARVATVLCVEDNPLNLALLEAIFALRPRINLLIAADGARGLELIQRGCPDLVLIDINLPDMSGVEVLKKIRQTPQGQHVPCIAMSADVSDDPLSRAQGQGFLEFWPKPLNVDSVLLRLDSILAATQSTR